MLSNNVQILLASGWHKHLANYRWHFRLPCQHFCVLSSFFHFHLIGVNIKITWVVTPSFRHYVKCWQELIDFLWIISFGDYFMKEVFYLDQIKHKNKQTNAVMDFCPSKLLENIHSQIIDAQDIEWLPGEQEQDLLLHCNVHFLQLYWFI